MLSPVMPMEHDPIGRSESFEIPAGVTYLNAAFMSPIPRCVREAGERGVVRKSAPWLLTRASFYDIVEEARAEAAGLIEARPQDVAITGSVSYGIATIARNLDLDAGKVVLTLADEHPSPVYAWLALASERLCLHEEIARPADHDWTAAILRRLDDRSRPAVGVLSLTPLHWNDGALVDLAAIRTAADAASAVLVVDGTQAIGAQPFSVRAVRPDYLVFPTYKWLLGPYGLAFLYVDPERQHGRPLEQHVWSRAGADAITNRYERTLEFMEGARRYDMGERANFVALPMATAGIQLLRRVGLDAIAAHVTPLTTRIAEGAAELGFTSPPAALRAGHITGLRRPRLDAAAAARCLAELDIHVSARNGALRISSHLYNDVKDVARFLEGLASV